MEKIKIFGDLIIHRDLITGSSGKLYAKDHISCGYSYCDNLKALEDVLSADNGGEHIYSDYCIDGKLILVYGSVHIWNEIITDDHWGDWRVTAGVSQEDLDELDSKFN